ncbi:hypothetical protein Tco_0979877 [Tanacetum coccineum]
MEPLPAANQRHPWLRYQIEEYTKEIRRNEARSGSEVEDGIFWRGTTGGVRRRMTWRQFILALGLHMEQEMAEAGFGAYWARSDRLIPNKGDLRDNWMEILSDKDFLGPAPSYAPEKVIGVDLFTANVPRLLAQYLFRHAEGRKSRARLSRGHFIGRLAMHFWLVSDEGLRGLQGPKRQQAAAAGALEADEDGQAAEEAAPEILALTPAPAQAPPPPPPALHPLTMSQRIKRLEEEVHDLRRDVVGLRGDFVSFTIEHSRVSTWLISCMTQLMDASGQTYQPFDSTLVGSLGLYFRRCVRPRTGDASTSAALHTDAQPDP